MLFFLSFLAFLITFLLINLFLPFLKKYLLDKPNNRSLHKIPIPKSGGVFFAITSSLLMYFLNNPIGIISLPLSFIGALDDKLNISRKVRYFSQLITVGFMYFLGRGFFQVLKIDDFLKGEEDYYLRIIFNLPFNKNILETFYAQRINNEISVGFIANVYVFPIL